MLPIFGARVLGQRANAEGPDRIGTVAVGKFLGRGASSGHPSDRGGASAFAVGVLRKGAGSKNRLARAARLEKKSPSGRRLMLSVDRPVLSYIYLLSTISSDSSMTTDNPRASRSWRRTTFFLLFGARRPANAEGPVPGLKGAAKDPFFPTPLPSRSRPLGARRRRSPRSNNK